MVSVAEAFISLRPQVDGFQRDAEQKIGTPMKGIAKGIATALGGAFAVQKGFELVRGALDAAAESNKIAAQTAAVLKSTGGAAGVTADFVGKLSHSLQNLSGVSDENVQAGANMLLTFKGIKNEVGAGNDIFTQATKTLLDMSVATGQDMPSAAVQLGKALNDPIAGISALSRVGVTFTDQQKEQIRTLVATGDAMGAQKIILSELNTEFGGSAKAAGDALTPMERLSIKWGDMQEQLGTWLIPKIEALVAAIGNATDFYERNRKVLEPLILVLGSATAAIVATTFATNVATAAAAAFGVTLNVSLGPIALVTAAIAALAVGIIYAYKHSDTFRAVVDAAFHAVADAAQFLADVVGRAFTWVKDHIDLILAAMGPLGWAVLVLQDNWETVWNAVSGAIKTAWDIVRPILHTLKQALDDIAGPLGKVLGGIGKVGGAIGGAIGKIPGFADGGVVPGPIGAPLLALVHGGEQVLTPGQRQTATVERVESVTIPVYLDGVEIARHTLRIAGLDRQSIRAG